MGHMHWTAVVTVALVVGVIAGMAGAAEADETEAMRVLEAKNRALQRQHEVDMKRIKVLGEEIKRLKARLAEAGVEVGQEKAGTKEAERASAIKAVGATLRSGLKIERWQVGALRGGTAVLGDEAAWWVDADGGVWAANGFAQTWSPGIKYAPVGIDINSVEKAVGKE